ncbi:MAG: acyltransferase domain-containing protein, partial [Proteobacteria bacterium]|nr:acyltransferase domain-containing protein [Pseudomonadota bacterium]
TVRPWKRTMAVAGVNAPQLIVVSGLREDMDRVLVDFRRRNMMVRELPVSLPLHSPLMNPILEEFEKLSRRFEFRKVTIPWASNLTGQFLGDKEAAGPEYWRKHIREPVRFWSGMECLANAGYEVFLEIGPGRTLVTMGKEAIGEAAGIWINSLEKGTNSREVLWKAAQRLAQDEVQVDLELARNDCFSRE